MTMYVVFLRGINVGGNTKVSMKELVTWCKALGLERVRTYINSGNIICESSLSEDELTEKLENILLEKTDKTIAVVVRTIPEVEHIVSENPFPDGVPSQVGVLLTRNHVPEALLQEFSTPGNEEVTLGKREVYIHYVDGMGRSKLKFPKSLRDGTVRNINTLTKLLDLARV